MKKLPEHVMISFTGARKIGFLCTNFIIFIVFITIFTGCAVQDAFLPGKSTASTTPVPSPTPNPFANNAQVGINAGQPRALISGAAFGLNTAVWDNHLLDPAVPGLLSQAGVTLLRFPGGSTSDVYHWKTQSFSHGLDKNSYINPNNTFDAFMGVVQKLNAQALITVNYGSNESGTDGGDPAEAAAWVYYANMVKHYGIKYWEIGNEVYGNGSYGSKWEADLHAEKGPAAYANNVLQFARAMKAVDPSIKIGIALTTPVLDNGRNLMADWDPTVLGTACSQIDFVDLHWYPRLRKADGRSADAQLLASPALIPNFIAQPRNAIMQACGARADAIQLFLGEVNTDISVKQKVSIVNALFLADVYMSWLENGGTNATWWDLHNGIETPGNNAPQVYGNTDYGDPGILSNGSCAAGNQCDTGPCTGLLCEPAANQPFAPYYGLAMLAHLGKPGDQIVTSASRLDMVTVHAIKQANGDLALLLINKDPVNSLNPIVSIIGYTPASSATIYTFGMNKAAIASASATGVGTAIQPVLPPYSLTTIVLTPARTSTFLPVSNSHQLTASLPGGVRRMLWR